MKMFLYNLDEENGCYRYLDEFGEPVKRTPMTHPYNYDSFVLWKADGELKSTTGVYTDRIFEQDSEKYNRLCKKHFCNISQVWSDRDTEGVEAFLRDLLEKPDLVLTMVMQGCNQASGFPVWILFYREDKQ